MFFSEAAGRFALGQILPQASLEYLDDITLDGESGRWACDIEHGEDLTWTAKVYELFGLPNGSLVTREDAVARYAKHSRGVLDYVRQYSLDHGYGFVLDAEIRPQPGRSNWIRILAVPITRLDRIVGLRGLKRAL